MQYLRHWVLSKLFIYLINVSRTRNVVNVICIPDDEIGAFKKMIYEAKAEELYVI